MMSISTVSAGAASSGYYKSEGYYAAGSEEGDAAATWFGEKAESLGLEGRVDDALFTQMLEGVSFKLGKDGPEPDKLMGKIIDGERQHRPGFDLTFSAPKSVSIAALVYQDERLIKAHDQAVVKAMEYVEKKIIQTRLYKNGSLEVETGGKIVAGLFRHDTSRALDPQLHTHAVIANMVENSTGNTTALHNDLIFRTQKLGSEIYRNELARGAMEAGYTVDRVGKERLVELREIPKELVDNFSKRRSEMEAAMAGRGMKDNPRTAELAALATRAVKNGNVDRHELQKGWLKEAKDLNIDIEKMKEVRTATLQRAAMRIPGVTRAGSPPAPYLQDARDSLAKSIAHISERNTSYSENDLLTTALAFSEKADVVAINHAITEAKREGTLIPIMDGERKTEILTDKTTLADEREMTRSFRTGARTPGVILKGYTQSNSWKDRKPETSLTKRLEYTTLSDGQKAAVVTSLTGKGQFVGVQGYAGTGKTFMMAHLAKEATRAGYKVEGLAPSKKAVSELIDALPSSETLQARLLRQKSADKEADPKKTILIVDEASMISTTQMKALLQQANDQKIARVVLVGDVQQLDAVSAGTPFDLLQKIGMRTAVMDDIQRQRDGDTLAVVKHAIAGEVQEAFNKIGRGIIKAEDIAEAAAHKYLSVPAQKRETVGLVTPTNRVREAINEHVRLGLRDEGQLTGNDHRVNTLSPMRLSRVEAAETNSFEPGNVVIPFQAVKSAGLVKGRIYDVIEVRYEEKQVILKDRETGTTLPFSHTQNSKAAGSIELYERKSREFAIGDDVKFRINDPKENIDSGETAKITSINDKTIEFQKSDDSHIEIQRGSLAAAGLDHAYALTTHDFQGATVDKIIIAMTANEQLANQKSFYVAASRARDEITLITDDPEKLANRLEAQTGEKINALEAYVEAEKDRLHQKVDDNNDRGKDNKDNEEPTQKDTENQDGVKYSLKDEIEELQKLAQKQLGDYER